MAESFWINYVSSVAAGVTLALLGFGVYKIYNKTIQSHDTKQRNIGGDNIVINKPIIFNAPKKETIEIIKGLQEDES